MKEEVVSLGTKYKFNTIFVASYAHMVTYNIGGKWVYVDSEKEAVDLYIMNHAKSGDIVITQDFGLASVLVNRNVLAMSPRGKIFKEKDMDSILHLRYLSAKERRSGSYSKGPKPYSQEDRDNFLVSLEKICRNMQELTNDT